MNIHLFRNQFSEGFQSTNRALLNLSFGNKGLAGHLSAAPAPGIGRALQALATGLVCERTRLPDRSFDVMPFTQYTITESIPYKTDFTKFDCVFLLPIQQGRNAVAEVFYRWQNVIHDCSQGYGSSRDFTWPEHYYADAQLYTLDRQNQTTGCYIFERVYPIAVESVPVAWSDHSEMATLAVSFQYSTWHFTDDQAPLDVSDLWTEAPFVRGAFDDGVHRGTTWIEQTLEHLRGSAAGWTQRKVWEAIGGGNHHPAEPPFTDTAFDTRPTHPQRDRGERPFTPTSFDNHVSRSS